MTEKWKIVPGYERLMVSDFGNCKRLNYKFNVWEDYFPEIDEGGYLRCTYWLNNNRKRIRLHRAIALAFYGVSKLSHVRHLNDNKLDNRLINIAYGTHQQNMKDKRANGKQIAGEGHVQAKLTQLQAEEIKEKYMPYKYSQYTLAKEYNVSQMVISKIVRGLKYNGSV